MAGLDLRLPPPLPTRSPPLRLQDTRPISFIIPWRYFSSGLSRDIGFTWLKGKGPASSFFLQRLYYLNHVHGSDVKACAYFVLVISQY